MTAVCSGGWETCPADDCVGGPEAHDARVAARPMNFERLGKAISRVVDVTTRERVLPYLDKIAAEYDRLAESGE